MKHSSDRGELKVNLSYIMGEYEYDEMACKKVADVLDPILHDDPRYPNDGYILVGYENIGEEPDVNYGGEFIIEAEDAIELIQNSDLDDDLKDSCISHLRDKDLMLSLYQDKIDSEYIPDDREPWHEQ